jgi:RNA polymerase sigma factor (sigma-70 family)
LRQALDADALAGASDTELLAHFRRHCDPAAFEAIVHRHGPRVVAACRRVLADPADADDAVQATFLVLMRKPGSVRDGRALAGWLSGTAHRIALKVVERRQRREAVEARGIHRPSESPDLSWREACLILHEELDRLPDRHRLPLILCYLEGLSRDEAAARLGRSVSGVKKALEVGRVRLRKRLIRRGVTLSAGLLAAAAEPVGGMAPIQVPSPASGPIRPAVTALANSLDRGFGVRTVGVGLAATVLVLGLALGPPGGPSPGPVAGKDGPAKEAAKGDQVTISGKVVDSDGKPVNEATLSLAGWETTPGKGPEPKTLGKTGPDGRFEFKLSPDDITHLRQPQLVATATARALDVQPVTVAGAKDLTFKLPRDALYSGSLYDRMKQPVAGARVRVVAVWLPDGDDTTTALQKLRKTGWEAATGAEPAAPLTRRVTSWAGRLPGFPEEVKTDARGGFTITGLGWGRFAILLAERPGMLATEFVVLHDTLRFFTLPAKPNETPERPNLWSVVVSTNGAIQMVAASRGVHGRVTDRTTGKPIKDAIVRAVDGPAYIWAASDADGWYHFDGLGKPPARLTASPPNDASLFDFTQPVPDRPEGEEPVHLDFRLTRGVWLTGRVVEARTNAPVAGARVVYHPARDNKDPSAIKATGYPGGASEKVTSVWSEAVTGRDGRFRMPAAAGRGWLLVENPPGGHYYTADQREVQGDITERTPARELPVGLRETDSPGSYVAVVSVHTDRDRGANCTVTLEPEVLPEIRFVDPDGQPLAGVITNDRRLTGGRPPQPLPAKVTAVERFNPEGPPELVVFHPERKLGIALRPKAGDAGPWTVQLKPTSTVTARLLHRIGKPIVNELVYVHAADGRSPLSPRPMEVLTDMDGRVRIPGIIGDAEYLLWCVELADARGGSRSRTFSAKAGEIKDLGDLRTGDQ